ncbi:MAG TPA: hypothetical protein VEF76_02635 [Patescibacteria group bacterium]|nr:hypothetical protein [Patescibacteria group bacterium]
MSSRLLNRILLNSVGILLGAAIAAAVATAHAEDLSAGAEELSRESSVVETGDDKKIVEIAPANPDAEMPATDAAVEHEVKEDIGFPQLKAKSYPSQVLWLFISFALLYTLMSKLALPKVSAVLDQRRAQREGNLTRAEQLQEEAAKAKTSYEAALAKAHESAQEAMSAADAEISARIAAESAKFAEATRKRVATAEQGIAKAKEEAMASLADISAEISAEIVAKVAGVQVSKADAKKIVTEVMKKEAA